MQSELEGKSKTIKKSNPTLQKVDYENIMGDFFNIALKECADEIPTHEELRKEMETFIISRGCEGAVAPQLITDYVIHRQGFLACEAMNRRIGRMTKDLKLSPYVTAGQGYYKAMQADFNLIMQIINKYSGNQNEEKNAFLELLMNRNF